MLTITDNARELVLVLSEQPEIPDDGGLRIAPGTDDPSQLQVVVAEGPEAGDEVIDLDGGRVFVEGQTAELLADSTLDAHDTPEGATFVLDDVSS